MNYLRQYQQTYGLVADGIIGKNTLSSMLDIFGLTDTTQLAYFLGQIAHESGYFKFAVENLYYSPDALLRVFGKYFKTYSKAKEYAYQPQRIANIVYANRMGNGGAVSNDGYKYRGRGSLQLTGKNNYRKFSKKMEDVEILCQPDIVAQKYYWEVALWYFDTHELWHYCQEYSRQNVKKLTRRINGGYNGLTDRIHLTEHFLHLTKLL